MENLGKSVLDYIHLRGGKLNNFCLRKENNTFLHIEEIYPGLESNDVFVAKTLEEADEVRDNYEAEYFHLGIEVNIEIINFDSRGIAWVFEKKNFIWEIKNGCPSARKL